MYRIFVSNSKFDLPHYLCRFNNLNDAKIKCIRHYNGGDKHLINVSIKDDRFVQFFKIENKL